MQIDVRRRQFCYLCHYNDNIEELRKQVKKLADTRDRVQGRIDDAKRHRESINADVQIWIAEVENINASTEKFLEYEVVKANLRCLGGWWCINLRSRYRLSKEARQMTLAILQIQEEGKFENVARRAFPPGLISSSEGKFEAFESRKSILKQIKEALNDETVSMIGICGIGGVGKTTLVKEIGKQAKEHKLYDQVAMVVVSKNPSIRKIQGETASMLGVTLSGNEESAIAGALWERIMMEKRILVILDDVWGRIDLEKVGIPSGRDHRGCNILLTTRNQEVCNQMGAQKIFTVGTLSKDESWVLFREAAGEVADGSDINPIAREVAAKSGGLPISILIVGRALKKKNDKSLWMVAADQLMLKKSTPTNIEGMHKNVISSLELSYNFLESEEAKSLFLFCCLFPEDSNIGVEQLVRCGMALRWFKHVNTVEEARVSAYAIISSLTSSFLLIGETNQKGYVKMHDMVRNAALIIASRSNNAFMVKAGIGLREWPIQDTFEYLSTISLISNDIHEAPEGFECPMLQVLLLQENSPLVISDGFFEGMKNLNVLDLSCIQPLSLPSSLSFLVNLSTLLLEDCHLGDLSVIGKLSSLEILSLSNSSIQEIPKSFSQLTNLKLLDLSRCYQLSLIPEGVISCLYKLEELYMWHSFTNWDLESNAKVVELQALSQLTNLMNHFPQNCILPKHIPFHNLTSFTITIGAERLMFSEIFFYKEINYSRRIGLSISPVHDWVKDLLKICEILVLTEIIGVENVDVDLVSEGFTALKYLSVQDCDSVKHLLNSLERSPHATFNKLEELRIRFCPKLVEICHGEVLPAECFSELKYLLVGYCGSILSIAPSHLVQMLQNLESCHVFNCSSLVHVFDLQGLQIVNEETKFLSSLEEIRLSCLPKLTHIWNGDIRFISLSNLKNVYLWRCRKLTTVFPQPTLQSLICLEEITISDCSNLNDIFGKKVGDREMEMEMVLRKNGQTTTSQGFQNLASIHVFSCGKLVKLFTTSIAKSLVKLKKLKVLYCSAMREIVKEEEGERGASEGSERIVFPSLYELTLRGLQSLSCFCSAENRIEYPVLQELEIVGCPNMKTFGYGDQVTPKLNNVKLDGEDRWMGRLKLNETLKQFFDEQEKIQKEAATRAGRLTENTASGS